MFNISLKNIINYWASAGFIYHNLTKLDTTTTKREFPGSFIPNISNSMIFDWRTHYSLWWFYDYTSSLKILCCMPYSGMQHSIYWRHLIYAGVLLCWGGGFRLYMYPRVGLASSPVPARACSTTRSTMRVSSEDTESSDLHVHAGYPVTD